MGISDAAVDSNIIYHRNVISRLKQEISDNEESVKYWEKLKDSEKSKKVNELSGAS